MAAKRRKGLRDCPNVMPASVIRHLAKVILTAAVVGIRHSLDSFIADLALPISYKT